MAVRGGVGIDWKLYFHSLWLGQSYVIACSIKRFKTLLNTTTLNVPINKENRFDSLKLTIIANKCGF